MKLSKKERIVRWLDQFVNGSPPWTWTLAEALEFVKMLEPIMADVGWHVAMAGSVLFQGESIDDLDIIVYPHSTATSTREQAYEGLRSAELEPWLSRDVIVTGWRAKGSNDDKWVEAWRVKAEKWRARRVDVFFLK